MISGDISHLLAGVLVVAPRMQGTHISVDGHANQDDGALLGKRAAQQSLKNAENSENALVLV